ncbi:MAG: hypothetical protein ACRDHN_14835 [Thermomicrobiales bacterium]
MYVERTRLRPYPVPELSLPAQSRWGQMVDDFDHEDASDSRAVRIAITHLAHEQASALDHLENAVVSPRSFAASMTNFAEVASGVAQLASALDRGTQPLPSREMTLLFENGDRRAANHAIYDQFFRVTRDDDQSQAAFAGCILSAYARVLFDFPYASIARAEILAILRAMVRSLEIIGGDTPSGLTVLPFISLDPNASPAGQLSDGWDASDLDPDWMTHVADHRWISGHHLFFIFSNFCRVSRDRAADALQRADHDAVAAALFDAATFQRALASAMWYAGDFPPSLYRSHTRPWMTSAGSANGFSGSDNVDYADLHTSRAELTASLFATLGRNAEEWPPQIERALRTLHEAEVQHAEHHVLIAARMVGTDASLVQKRMTRVVFNAVDVLRDMVAEEWTDLSNRFS